MTDAQHTPGPWSQSHRRRHDGMYSTEVYCADGYTIASCAWYPRPVDPATGTIGTYREANARLIAAAPDLLEALEWIANHTSADSVHHGVATAAIARASNGDAS